MKAGLETKVRELEAEIEWHRDSWGAPSHAGRAATPGNLNRRIAGRPVRALKPQPRISPTHQFGLRSGSCRRLHLGSSSLPSRVFLTEVPQDRPTRLVCQAILRGRLTTY